ncbi:MAG: hypothetical protein J1G01_02700 [Clostridiales bacterium]|nr:hypothetical protein [Clostridiales bacterium]
MNTSTANKLRKVIPSLILLAVIVLLAGLSFLPQLRYASRIGNVTAQGVDQEAMRVLGVCKAYAASNDFESSMNGKIKAKVFGIPYTQKIKGKRTVSGDNFCDVEESVSAIVKVGIKRECVDGKYTASRGDYKNKKFVYKSGREYDKDGYVAAYGRPLTGIVKYELDGAIISAEQLSEDTFRYTLDARRATAYARNEVKTTVGGNEYPIYESVQFTLTFDGKRAVKIVSGEKFRINKFGGTNCTAEYTEIFDYKD